LKKQNTKKEIFFILEIEEDKIEDYIKKFEKNYNIEKLNQKSIKLTRKEFREV
jgi:hypothetical protein